MTKQTINDIFLTSQATTSRSGMSMGAFEGEWAIWIAGMPRIPTLAAALHVSEIPTALPQSEAFLDHTKISIKMSRNKFYRNKTRHERAFRLGKS